MFTRMHLDSCILGCLPPLANWVFKRTLPDVLLPGFRSNYP